MFCNKFKNSQNNDIQITYSGILLIRSPMPPQNLAVLTGWPYYHGYFYKENIWRFLPGGRKKRP